jgi:hypothetical protein
MRAIQIAAIFSLCLTLGAAQNAETPQAKVSSEALTAEQIAVYRTVLENYIKDSKDTLNLANKTESLSLSFPSVAAACTAGFDLRAHSTSAPIVHQVDSEVARNLKATLVDPDLQNAIIRKYDPQNLVRRAIDGGEKVSDQELTDSVKKAFENGLFTLSEMLFDKPHHRVLVSYSFDCGELCGHGETLLVEKTGGKWKIAKRCGRWVS